MKLEDIEGVIFDLDETLIDAQQGLSAAHVSLAKTLQEYLRQKGVTRDQQEVLERLLANSMMR